MSEWHYSKNTASGLDPAQLVEGSNKYAWWICATCHYEWKTQICKRAVRGQGCPICGKRKQAQTQAQNRVAKGRSLAENHPDLITEWDYDKNTTLQLDPLSLVSGSSKKAWWRCSVCNHVWEAQISKRTVRGQGCPACGREKQNQMQKERIQNRVAQEGSFADAFPELVVEWDYKKNENTPYDYLPRSSISVHWVCAQCGHCWKAKIVSRANGHGCKKCGAEDAKRTLLAKLIAEHGSLADNNPTLAEEWHPTKNGTLTPYDVMMNSNRKVWWKCRVCSYEWESDICNRNIGHGCHRCQAEKQKLSQSIPIAGVNDLASQRPDLAAEWHPVKNGTLTPSEVAKSANKKVWWLGKCGHEWEATINSRHYGRGCPVCVREFKISYPEKALFFYIKKQFSEYDVVENYKPSWLHGKEIDIYIKKLRVGIEYDGVAWHKDTKADNEKDALCKLHGIDLLRIREKGAPELNSTNIFWVRNCSEIESELVVAIEFIFQYLKIHHGIDREAAINLDRDRIEIYSLLELQKKENSIAALFPNVAKQWHPTKNGYITPDFVSAHTHKDFWWLCPLGHEYLMTVKHKTEQGSQCPICSNHRILPGFNDLQTKRPDIAAEWHPTLNGSLTPSDVMEFSNQKVWWQCPQGHAYQYLISHRTSKVCRCPICTNRQLCVGVNDLCTVNPAVASEWDYEKNGDLKPSQFTPISGKRVSWKCSVCGYEWDIKIRDRFIVGHGCQKCAGKKRQETRKVNKAETNGPKV
jgi:rubrerythrin